ncbi:hypothetical protein EV359DRAFT_84095 [Lentinula novae-zelandiae]|nr:hypothetical protein EV359DRAFT_84095 [Lentinula novae-zelandiae]
MSTSHTTTQTTSDIGSIPITGGAGNQPPALNRPTTPSASDKEWELEEQLKRDRERLQQFKEKRKAEEEAARRVAEEKKQREEAAARAASARKREEEAADKRRRAAAAAAAACNCRGPSPSEATTSATRVEVEIPRLVKKPQGRSRIEASGGDPDDGDDGGDVDDDEEWAPCERCFNKRIPCLEQAVDGGIGEPGTVQNRIGEAKASEEKKGRGGD